MHTVAAHNTLAFWQNPVGVTIPNDPLKFLYITDEAEHMMVSWLAKRVFDYQLHHAGTERQFTKMIMITMGALLPGVLLQDYITHCATPDMPDIEFGTFGVKCYIGPGQPLEHPEIVQPLSIDVRGHTVGMVEDLIDLGGTARFVRDTLTSEKYGARDVVIIAPYRKSAAVEQNGAITFGFVPKDTWIITPRERVETMVKRVPFWARNGADKATCINNLRHIGYPQYLIDDWFDTAWMRVGL
ncbi:MAG: phosphoribosyltransferase [Chloroflexi bacterium]|nr:phosphoribosyltransferase [Chloroflexota bacterium]MCC6895738.1 phosphoribosyltransferase [Anaerolineae bacterium]